MSWIYGCVIHCYKEDVRNETLEDQITAIIYYVKRRSLDNVLYYDNCFVSFDTRVLPDY